MSNHPSQATQGILCSFLHPEMAGISICMVTNLLALSIAISLEMFPLQANLVTLRTSCKVDPFSLNLAFFGFPPICCLFFCLFVRLCVCLFS